MCVWISVKVILPKLYDTCDRSSSTTGDGLYQSYKQLKLVDMLVKKKPSSLQSVKAMKPDLKICFSGPNCHLLAYLNPSEVFGFFLLSPSRHRRLITDNHSLI